MIVGIGIDIVRIERVAEALERFGDRFARRVLCEGELLDFERLQRPAAFLARRFALKEAVAKALGCGISRNAQFREIEVGHDERGKPNIVLHGTTRDYGASLGAVHYHASVSDDSDYATGMVVIETG